MQWSGGEADRSARMRGGETPFVRLKQYMEWSKKYTVLLTATGQVTLPYLIIAQQ